MLGNMPSTGVGHIVGTNKCSFISELEIARCNPHLLVIAYRVETPNTIVWRNGHVDVGKRKGGIFAALDSNGGIGGSILLHTVTGIHNHNLQAAVITFRHVDVEILAVGDVLRLGADEGSGEITTFNIGDCRSLTAVVNAEVTIDLGVGGNGDAAHGSAFLLQVDFQHTAEVFELQVLIV